MSEPKPFASLSSGLLARKGAARPAMRPQGFGQAGAGLEDLGWNDMGFDPPKAAPAARDGDHDAFGDEVVEHPRALHPTGLSPVESPVHSQQAAIAGSFATTGDSGEESLDEDFDETAEPYDPEAPFVSHEDGDEDEDEDGDEVSDAGDTAAAAIPDVVGVAPAPFAPKKQMALEPPVEAERAVDPEPQPRVAVAVAVRAEAAAPRRAPRPRSAPGLKGKAAFTLRLDPDRHLKLRLACAVNGRSAQMLVTDALDQLLESMPELQAMAEKANRKG